MLSEGYFRILAASAFNPIYFHLRNDSTLLPEYIYLGYSYSLWLNMRFLE